MNASIDPTDSDITEILNRAVSGDDASRERLYTLLYDELIKLAKSHLHGSNAISLNPSALVHEAYLRMLNQATTRMRNRRAFFAYASAAMRSALIDHVRSGAAQKRGGQEEFVTVTTGALGDIPQEENFSRLNEALEALQQLSERRFRVVEMRYFAGMSEEDIAAELAVSVPTVKRDWRNARAFLFQQLR